jgi:hypothetical protein
MAMTQEASWADRAERAKGIPHKHRRVGDFVALAEHYLNVGMLEIHLSDEEHTDKPWALTHRCVWSNDGSGVGYNVAGASVTLDPTVRFVALHPCGLTFIWTMTMITTSSIGIPELDVEQLKSILTVLRRSPHAGTCRSSLLAYAREMTDKVRSAASNQRLRAEEFLASCNHVEDQLRALWD